MKKDASINWTWGDMFFSDRSYNNKNSNNDELGKNKQLLQLIWLQKF